MRKRISSVRPSSRRILARSGTAMLAAAALVLSAAGSAPASFPARAQRLLVKTEGTFGTQVAVMDERGRVRSYLGIDTGVNGGIAVSPTGTRLAYVRTRTDVPGEIPAGIRRRFERQPQSTLEFNSFLFSTRIGGSFSFDLLGPPIRAAVGRPAWAPGGRRIAFSQARSGEVHLHLLETGFRGTPHRLTSGAGRDLNPRWSPDGKTIVFERRRGGESDLYAVRRNGRGLRLLVGWPGRESEPDFSPDGRSLVFSSDLSGRFQLYVVPAEGGVARRLTESTGDDTRPAWSPDGRWIAFSSDRDDDNDVFLIDPSGGRERKLTHNATEDVVQDWQPLRDARAPIVRALPSTAPRGRPARLRFVVRDASPRVLVSAELEFTYRTPDVGGLVGTGDSEVVRTGSRKVHVLTVSPSDLFEESGVIVPARGRFCLVAVDLWGNTSRASCAAFRFR